MIEATDDAPEQLPEPAAVDHGQPAPGNPEAFRLRGSPPQVTRLSRKAMAMLGIAAGVGIGGSLIYALQPRPPVTAPQNVSSGDTAARSELVTGAPADYSKVPKLGPPLPGDLGRPILNAQADGKTVAIPPMGAQTDPRAAAAEQARQRLVQEKESARTSQLFLANGRQISRTTTSAAELPVDGSPRPTLPLPAANAGDRLGSNDGGSRLAGKQAFFQIAADRSTESTQRLTAPTSPYILQAGSIIPAALITGIRSDLPGQITAQVTENVYDSPTGRTLLIPQGSRLIGNYDSDVAAGQDRVLLAWDRLILPGGRSILLDKMPGADAAGMAGLQDHTDYHWGNLLKAAVISTLMGVGAELATNDDDQLLRALRYGSQDTINQTGRQLVQRGIDVAPTLTIRPGYPLRVMVTHDLVLAPVPGTDNG
ncbi:type IV secretion system protein VirB10 [Hephaestia caeni]|jgi:type IV secretion system protein VirB10|uniref:Type IV secretion system protein VirB10 n=1 Tax=Hephaestia caeni TaxID=645617 RepID=A0A397PF40_9SPHN|nr:TrbI/VirB10 family protein [Hephaestia caeni]RIA44291.1 type IV secretion system protein VirB10 [Hephaestia caeni]